MAHSEIRDVSKNFGATAALAGVSMTVQAGEVHGLLGENGAGKSTLMKVLSGMVTPDSGEVTIGGRVLRLGSPRASREIGLAMAYQELSAPPNITVATKLCLPDLPTRFGFAVSQRELVARARARLQDWEAEHLDPRALISELSLAARQEVEIVAALASSPSLLVLDEPTAALPDPSWLFRQLKRITADGASVIYISHKLNEIKEICDTGTVLRNGRAVAEFTRGEFSEDELVELMIGRSFNHAFPAKPTENAAGAVVLDVTDLAVGTKLNGVSLQVRAGEIVGVAGLEGQGQRELFYALAGEQKPHRGTVRVTGDAAGDTDFALVPEERKTEALFLQMGADFNLTLPLIKRFSMASLLSRRREKRLGDTLATSVNLPHPMLKRQIADLSGGNQQKVVFGRAIAQSPRCLLLFDPTRGVDAATKLEIYKMTRDFAAKGHAVLLYSTEIPELVGLCDRVCSLYNGQIVAEHAADQLDEAAVMHSILGRSPEAVR
ncbi:ribose transport system ATP-binding protein [Mycobacterium frederiksbergense]|uniref:Ribose transport system ATP-binding protein n=1 Tax=Mycolicibacterium frederiksbergense TaxID=117567 RepID=A0ABT6L146_9MYCO|nr:sugar ABC transporter ATP-binding protein [Mycolicibacterium frederiksbergense]MDH6196674.1 ribose transport system ATP-binding protein [Mycolicibacterium frederiksbergense]